MGKGSKPRPVGKGYGAEIERIFGKRCVHNRDPEKCAVCLERAWRDYKKEKLET